MRPVILIGSALTGALLTMIAAVIAGVVAAERTSVSTGVSVRAVLVVVALTLTAVIWWLRMRPSDRPEALFVGLLLAAACNVATWTGTAFAAQLFVPVGPASFVVDIVLWAAVAYGLVLLLSHTSAPVDQR